MIVTYRGYTHQAKESNFQVSSEIQRTPGEFAFAVRRSITQSGAIFGDDQAGLITNINALLKAYAVDGGDYSVTFADGTVTPDINILNENCIGGVKVTNRPSLDPKNLAEYSYYWDYSIQLEAIERLTAPKSKFLWDFEESLDFEGDGGPKTVWVPLKFGPAQRQQTRTNTMCRLTQRGHMTFLNGRPGPEDIPRPLFPDLRVPEESRISKPHPRRINGDLVEWRRDYVYVFESATPFPDIEPNIIR